MEVKLLKRSCRLSCMVALNLSALPCHRCPGMCQFVLHSAPPGGAWRSVYLCGSFGAVALCRYPGADPRLWEHPACTPTSALLPPVLSQVDTAEAKWKHCSWSACSCQGCPTSSSSQYWLRTWDNKETTDKKPKQAKGDRVWFKVNKKREGFSKNKRCKRHE